MTQRALDHYGRLDVVFSNAAAYVQNNVTGTEEAEWDRTLDICLKATWMIAHCVVPAMLAQGGGVIVITGSIHAIQGYANYTAYQAAKGGLLALTRSLAADCAPSIRVNTILPGSVITGMWDGVPESRLEEIAQMCPLKRNGQPEDIAHTVSFLVSEGAGYVSGQVIYVAGGPRN